MHADSKKLAHRIDILIAFQNGEEIEYRAIRSKNLWVGKYGTSSQDLSFNFEEMEYRVKPVLIEGWIDPSKIHSIKQAGCPTVGCIHVRQVVGDE